MAKASAKSTAATPPTPGPKPKPAAASAAAMPAQQAISRLWDPSVQQLIIFCAALAGAYYAYSSVSNGFYQQDEAAHFLSMRRFWLDPNSVLSNWEKAGYKLIYAPIALLGEPAVRLFNCLVAAATCGLVWAIGRELKLKTPALALLLLAAQPLWIQLSFRNYAELPSALMLAAAVLLHLQGRLVFSALLVSYIAFMRQEFYPILGIYGIWLLVQRQWLSAVLLAVFPLVHNIWGWKAEGDPLFLLHSTLGFGAQIADAYTRQGGEHYLLTSAVIFGAVPLTLFVGYLALVATRALKPHWLLLVPTLVYIGLHILFNVKALELGPATGGNLRYLIVVSPLIALMGALAIERVAAGSPSWDRVKVGIALSVFVLLVAAFMTYDHNWVVLSEEVLDDKGNVAKEAVRSWGVFMLSMMAAVLLMLGLAQNTAAWAFGGLTLLATVAALNKKSIKLGAEDAMMKQVVQWVKLNKMDDKTLMVNHTMFYYYYGRAPEELAPKIGKGMTDSLLKRLPQGSLVLWDSHYSYRPQLNKLSVNMDYFTAKPTEYKLAVPQEQFVTTDGRFGVLVFEKLSPADKK